MKPNSYLIGFGGLSAFLGLSHFFVVVKYFQLLIHHSIYYCQTMAKTLNMQIPSDISRIYIGFLVPAVAYTIIKIGVAVIKIYTFKKTLIKTATNINDELGDLCNKLDLRKKVVLLHQHTPQAFCFGLFSPKIYVSTGLLAMMSDKEVEIILRHEQYHLNHKDSLAFLLAAIVESLFPFFPIISDFIRVYRTDREVQADTMAIKESGDKHSLAEVLKKLLQYEPTASTAFVAGIISEDVLEARIRSLLSQKPIRHKAYIRNIVFSATSLVILLGLMVNPVNAIELHDSGRDVVMVCSSTVNCASVCHKETLLQLQSHAPRYSPANFSSQY